MYRYMYTMEQSTSLRESNRWRKKEAGMRGRQSEMGRRERQREGERDRERVRETEREKEIAKTPLHYSDI